MEAILVAITGMMINKSVIKTRHSNNNNNLHEHDRIIEPFVSVNL